MGCTLVVVGDFVGPVAVRASAASVAELPSPVLAVELAFVAAQALFVVQKLVGLVVLIAAVAAFAVVSGLNQRLYIAEWFVGISQTGQVYQVPMKLFFLALAACADGAEQILQTFLFNFEFIKQY
ncbi:hypothetical protein BpHYR1_026071 [Brachionus plicatilis]|uniref:Uncharacterized protein n=1 Tax=Brachionus plicatilis TaxID=10195 RepID=A0A3M7RE46_BRAPC|nr:hypothetical protein BpHYR1_026071 [Brachionus plicatilis]